MHLGPVSAGPLLVSRTDLWAWGQDTAQKHQLQVLLRQKAAAEAEAGAAREEVQGLEEALRDTRALTHRQNASHTSVSARLCVCLSASVRACVSACLPLCACVCICVRARVCVGLV